MHTFSVNFARKIKKASYIPLPRTTLYTEKGPAPLTIWWDTRDPKDRKTFTVKEVDHNGRASFVNYEDGNWDLLDMFHQLVANGHYVLVGTEHVPMSNVPHLF